MTRPASRRPIQVRPANPDDVPAIREVALSAWHATYRGMIPRRAIERFLARAYSEERVALRLARHDVLVALRSPSAARAGVEPVPVVQAFAECSVEDGHLQLVAFYAHPRARGRGLGGALLDAVIERYPGLDITADVLVGNVRGEPFYASRGFVPVEVLEEELGGALVSERRWWLRAPAGRHEEPSD